MENGELRMENECDGLHGFIISHYERYTVGNGKAKCGNAARKGAMRCDLGVPNLTI